MQNNNQKKFALSAISKACFLAVSVSSMPLLAAEEAQAAKKSAQEEEVEVITVSGIRGSIQQSMNDKRFSSEIMDGISAEDIGQLPDENIAEALQRVTGIQMTRDADGEGSTIQVRGVSSNNVEINGQTSSGTGDERSVNFQDLPSELFSGIEVLKATTADRIEGALGATINLKTRRPLRSKKDQTFSVTTQAKYSELADKTAPDFNVFAGKNWRDTAIGDFGFVATVAHRESFKRTEAYGGADSGAWLAATGNWYRNDQSQGGYPPFVGTPYRTYYTDSSPFDLNNDGDKSDKYYMYGGFSATAQNTETTRDSFNGTLQWQPNDEMNFFVDVTLTDSEEEVQASAFRVNTTNAGPTVDFAQNFTSLGVSGDGTEQFVHDAGTISGVNIRMGGAPSLKQTFNESAKFTIGGDIQITDDLNIAAQYSTSKGESYSKQVALTSGFDYNSDSIFNGKDHAGIISFDMRGTDLGSYTLYNAPNGNDPLVENTDPTNIMGDTLTYFQLSRNGVDSEQFDQSFKIDATLDLDTDFITTIKTGLRFANRSFARSDYLNKNQKNTTKRNDEEYLDVAIRQIAVNPSANSGDTLFASTGLTEAELSAKLAKDCHGTESIALDNFSGNAQHSWTNMHCGSDYFTKLFDLVPFRQMNADGNSGVYEVLEERFDVEEDTYAAYIRADFYSEIFDDMNVFGNFGARYINTAIDSSGFAGSDSGLAWKTIENNYHDFLPSLNVNLGLNDEMVLRFAAAKVMSRAGLSALSPSLKLLRSEDIEPYAGVAQSGDPFLKPVRATNVDLSFEWYYTESSMFSTAIFYKDIESTITLDIEANDDVSVGAEVFKHYKQINGEGTKLRGVELALTHTFDNLPGLLSYTGMSANYTFTEEPGTVLDQEGDPMGRRGLSEDSANLVAFYDDKKLSVRLAYNWRSEFSKRQIVPLGWLSEDSLPEIEESRGQLDLSANYRFNRHLRVNFSVINLNDTVTERYLKYKELTNYLSESGRRVNLGVAYRF